MIVKCVVIDRMRNETGQKKHKTEYYSCLEVTSQDSEIRRGE